MGDVSDFLKQVGNNKPGIVMPDSWVFATDEERAELVVADEHGVHHASVLCNGARVPPNATVDVAPRVDGAEPFLVAMCDFMVCIDAAVMYEPHSLKHPDRRWPVDQEAPGVITCLFCLGS